jgi:hypothetical protein
VEGCCEFGDEPSGSGAMDFVIKSTELRVHISHGDECEGSYLLRCCAVLMMETVSTSETAVDFYQTVGRRTPEYVMLS